MQPRSLVWLGSLSLLGACSHDTVTVEIVHAPSNATLSALSTDADGSVVDAQTPWTDLPQSLEIDAGGDVTVRVQQGTDDLFTFVGVQPGDTLVIGGAPAAVAPTRHELTVTWPPVTGAVSYKIRSRCTGELTTTETAPRFAITSDCAGPDQVHLQVAAFDGTKDIAVANLSAPFADGTVAVTAWQPPGTLHVIAHSISGGEQVEDVVVAPMLDGAIATAPQEIDPDPEGGVDDTVTFDAADQNYVRADYFLGVGIHGEIADVISSSTAWTSDGKLPQIYSYPTYDRGSFAWGRFDNGDADGAVVSLSWFGTQDEPNPVNWTLIAPPTGSVALPALSGDLAGDDLVRQLAPQTGGYELVDFGGIDDYDGLRQLPTDTLDLTYDSGMPVRAVAVDTFANTGT